MVKNSDYYALARFLAIISFLITLVSCSGSSNVRPTNVESIKFSGEIHRFNFESAADELSIAFQKIYKAYTIWPTPQLDMTELVKQTQAGTAYLREHPKEAATALIAEAAQLNEFDKRGYMIIFHLLGQFDSAAGVELLYDQTRRPQPDDCTSGYPLHCSEVHIIILSALDALGQISEIGSARARMRLLDLVKNDNPMMQRQAIFLFYKKSGLSRWRSKREMKKRLPASKHYLLHEIY